MYQALAFCNVILAADGYRDISTARVHHHISFNID
jgi:hypothetical protein